MRSLARRKDGSKFFFFREKEVVGGCSWGGGSAWPLSGGGVNGDVGLMQGWLNKRFQHGILGCERWPSEGGGGLGATCGKRPIKTIIKKWKVNAK